MTIQEENKQLKELLWRVVKAQGRMQDRWAEGDDAVKKEIWQNLHNEGMAAREFLDSIRPGIMDPKTA